MMVRVLFWFSHRITYSSFLNKKRTKVTRDPKELDEVLNVLLSLYTLDPVLNMQNTLIYCSRERACF